MSYLADALSMAGDALGRPGAAARGLLAGRPDQLLNLLPGAETMGLVDPEERVSGRDLLRQHGLAGDEDTWGNYLGGLATEVATDPLSYLGGAAGRAAGRAIFGKVGPMYGGGASKLAAAAQEGGTYAAQASELAASPAASKVLGEIPQGSSLLTGGNNSLVFHTPQNDIVRVAGGAGGAPASRAAVPEMLQPTRNVVHGDYRVERLPFARNVGDRQLYIDSYKDMAGGLRSQGWHPADLHPGNVGEFGGRPVLVDPGAAVPLPRFAGARQVAPDLLGATPGKFGIPGITAGAATPEILRSLLASLNSDGGMP